MKYANGSNKPKRKRAWAFLLALCLTLSLLPALPNPGVAAPADTAPESDPPASDGNSDDQVQDSLDKLVTWGVMRGDSDGGLYPDRSLTRAEFTALVNRAYGYNEVGATPFEDVDEKAWYADDIAIAYTTGYFNGTSPTTAAPEWTLTRETALVLLARSLRLEEIPGQVVELADGNEVSDWARGYIRAAAQAGLISDDGGKGFRPTDVMTRGEMAELLTHCVGNLVKESGEHTLGNVYGNVTVNQSGTTLKDTTIAGDLYITGGVGLGGITLENTTVLGKIVVAGGGEAELGQDSVILRNVEAEELVVDSIRDQYNSVRSEGDTSIQNTTLRTAGFVQDRSDDGYGLLNVTLDGRHEDMSFTVSGNMKNVVNKTPGSILTVSDGAAKELTVDEKAVNSALVIERGGMVHQLNLDTGTEVSGKGDVESLQVSTSGSKVEMLPDKVSIRPGIISNIFGQDMDNQQAQESSNSPRLLAGYPKVINIASKTATAVFATNKPGTVYWAVSAQSDGSISEADLIRPGSYGNRAIVQGSVDVTAATEEFEAAIKDLGADGLYYLSAVLVDGRGNRSPLKVVAFGTPDDSVPAFAQGYPKISRVGIGSGPDSTQAMVMTNKSCILYYALFPEKSKAPTANDFRNGSLSGNLGTGSRTVKRNTEVELVNVNRETLKEQTKYDLYFWLNDIDGAKSSAVVKVSFETLDATPPKFVTDLYPTKAQATSVATAGCINEVGTVYWAAVKKGAHYPLSPSGTLIDYDDAEKFAEFLASDYAKIQVENGGGSPVKSGQVSAQENKDFTLTVSGLQAETAYDVYYVAKDKAGNYSDTVKVLTINTLDNVAPKASLKFDKFTNNDPSTPFANTDIDIVFSETVKVNNMANGELLTLYHAVTSAGDGTEAQWKAKQALATALSQVIKLYNVTGTNRYTEVAARKHDISGAVTNPADDWGLDFYNAKVLMDDTDPDGKRMIVRFENHEDDGKSVSEGAAKLKSGSTYYFELSGIADTSAASNLMGTTRLPGPTSTFTTISAQAILDELNLVEPIEYNIEQVQSDGTVTYGPKQGTKLPVSEFDMAFTMTPRSASTVEDNINWEMLFWTDTTVEFELYYKRPDQADWHKTQNTIECRVGNLTSVGTTLHRGLRGLPLNPILNELKDEEEYQFVIHFTKVNYSPTRTDWSQDINFRIQVVTGTNSSLSNQSTHMSNYTMISSIEDISSPKNFPLNKNFQDSNAPYFDSQHPIIKPEDISVDIEVQINRPGTVYYVLAPVGNLDAVYNGEQVNFYDYVYTETDGEGNVTKRIWIPEPDDDGKVTKPLIDGESAEFIVSVPTVGNITEPNFSNSRIKYGNVPAAVGAVNIKRADLEPSTEYFAYFVLQGANGGTMTEVMMYKFKTEKVIRPVITLDVVANPTVTIKSDIDAKTDYQLIANDSNLLGVLSQTFGPGQHLDMSEGSTESDSVTRGYWNSWMASVRAEGKDPETLTILDALLWDVNDGTNSLGSGFDFFAKPAVKTRVASFIRSQRVDSTPSSGGGGSAQVPGGDVGKPIDCSKLNMGAGVQYIFLAVGRSTANTSLGTDTSGDSFRAIRPVTLPNTEKPMVISIANNLQFNTTNGKISGSFTLNFNDYLFFYDDRGSQAQTRPIGLGISNPNDSVKFNGVPYYPVVPLISYGSLFGITGYDDRKPDSNGNVDQNIPSSQTRMSTIQFYVKGNQRFSIGTSVSLTFTTLNLCNDTPTLNKSNLQITITGVADPNDKTKLAVNPKITISSTWDGTGGSLSR